MSTINYLDMDMRTGERLTNEQQLRQSIQDILLTPLGSRVMRRQYGSALFALLDKPNNPAIELQLISAACIALYQWERRLTPTQITVSSAGEKGRRLTVTGQQKEVMTVFTMEVPLP
ncbi:GPW/gp25 family protein [Serratia marcescens]|uniref:GPW/gp25 family protein n=1 Tax=Serratia marcescens TaxID=615 RepID=UPI00095135A2|nr:GPW/gp25 family protein [Serratia marcescens]